MSNLTAAIESKCRAFAEELTELVTVQVREAFGALSSSATKPAPTLPGRQVVVRTAAARKGLGGLAPGEKRPPEAIANLAEELAAYIRHNAGQGIEQIAQGMGCSTRELNLPVKRLLRERRIRTVGHKRAMKYHPVGNRS